MSYKLVIVESPGKTKKIADFLGDGFRVRASFGHIRDLPEDELGLDMTETSIRPRYVVTDKGKKAVAELRRLAAEASEIYLCSDPDREGESIAWHIAQTLGGKHRYQRATFTEITAPAVTAALRAPRAIDVRLVDAQQARRVYDRVVGWLVSPALRNGTQNRDARSAGRVQSVAVRLVVEREREIRAFKPTNFFHIDAGLSASQPPPFRARLVEWWGEPVQHRVATKRDADELVAQLRALDWQVLAVEQKPRERRPPAPFTTSTLQQAASVTLKWSPKQTMEVAQRLYEAGLITYMRTDSVFLAASAVDEIRAYIAANFAPAYLPERPVVHANKNADAQEAHEAVRVVHPDHLPDAVAGDDDRALYKVIWQRTVACQMAAGRDLVTAITIAAGPGKGPEGKPFAGFLTRGTTREFDGWRAALAEASEEADPEKDLGDPTDSLAQLPHVAAGDVLKLGRLDAVATSTKPPPRYTEASLIKALEHAGVGRPATYAAIMETIKSRGYITESKRKLAATQIGELVIDYLVQHFAGDFIDVDFTRTMERELDQIAAGKVPWQPTIARASFALLARARAAGLTYNPLAGETGGPPPAAALVDGVVCPLCGKGMVKRPGKFGDFYSCSGFPACKGTRKLDGTPSGAAAPKPAGDPNAPACPDCGAPMALRSSAKGAFFGCTTYPKCKGTRDAGGAAKPAPAAAAPAAAAAPRAASSAGQAPPCPTCGGAMRLRTSARGAFYGCASFPQCRGVLPAADDTKRSA